MQFKEGKATMAGIWLTELTGARKPIIGMAHLPALPGTPLYDAAGGMRHARDWVARDLEALQGGGIDAIMFCNENDRPYRLDADLASVAAMADVVASLRGELSVPFGVNVLWIPGQPSPSPPPLGPPLPARSSPAPSPVILDSGFARRA